MLTDKALLALVGDFAVVGLGLVLWATGTDDLGSLARNGVLGLLCAIFIGQAWLRELRLAKESAERELLLREDIKATRDELREVREGAIAVAAKHAEQAEQVATVMGHTARVLEGFARSHPCAVAHLAPEVYADFVAGVSQLRQPSE